MEFYDFLIKTLAVGAKIMEVGVFYGRGLVHLAQREDLQIYGVDKFIRDQMPYHLPDIKTDNDFHKACLDNLHYNGADQVVLLCMSSSEASGLFPDEFFDCVFIDANHAYEPALNDIQIWRKKVKRGGLLAGDDYKQPWGGVIKAVDELLPHRSILGQTWYATV